MRQPAPNIARWPRVRYLLHPKAPAGARPTQSGLLITALVDDRSGNTGTEGTVEVVPVRADDHGRSRDRLADTFGKRERRTAVVSRSDDVHTPGLSKHFSERVLPPARTRETNSAQAKRDRSHRVNLVEAHRYGEPPRERRSSVEQARPVSRRTLHSSMIHVRASGRHAREPER